ncbi:MAG: hypothetical protein NT062_09505 [Proteobacteria bacterium]|nr:hypothetical protein [Pseudomonadota bacterium]
MANHIESDITVQRFAFSADTDAKKLTFPRADLRKIEGSSGSARYGALDCTFDDLVGRLDTLRWTADAASMGSAYLRDEHNRYDLGFQRVEMPSGFVLTRADRGVEILSPHVSLSEVKLNLRGPFKRDLIPHLPTTPPPPDRPLRQRRLRFLDSLSGRIYVTVKVELDLPVLGTRRLDQVLKLPIQEGSIDFRALDESLDWLEGAFLDIDMSKGRLAVQWKVPVFGRGNDLISWPLDEDATTLSSFGRVPVRSLFDPRVGSAKPPADGKKKGKVFQAISLDAIDIALSLLAPRLVADLALARDRELDRRVGRGAAAARTRRGLASRDHEPRRPRCRHGRARARPRRSRPCRSRPRRARPRRSRPRRGRRRLGDLAVEPLAREGPPAGLLRDAYAGEPRAVAVAREVRQLDLAALPDRALDRERAAGDRRNRRRCCRYERREIDPVRR